MDLRKEFLTFLLREPRKEFFDGGVEITYDRYNKANQYAQNRIFGGIAKKRRQLIERYGASLVRIPFEDDKSNLSHLFEQPEDTESRTPQVEKTGEAPPQSGSEKINLFFTNRATTVYPLFKAQQPEFIDDHIRKIYGICNKLLDPGPDRTPIRRKGGGILEELIVKVMKGGLFYEGDSLFTKYVRQYDALDDERAQHINSLRYYLGIMAEMCLQFPGDQEDNAEKVHKLLKNSISTSIDVDRWKDLKKGHPYLELLNDWSGYLIGNATYKIRMYDKLKKNWSSIIESIERAEKENTELGKVWTQRKPSNPCIYKNWIIGIGIYKRLGNLI